MYRTHVSLIKYYLPLLVLAGIVLALLEVKIPWYVIAVLFSIIIPCAVVLVIAIFGYAALTREGTRTTKVSETPPLPRNLENFEELVEICQWLLAKASVLGETPTKQIEKKETSNAIVAPFTADDLVKYLERDPEGAQALAKDVVELLESDAEGAQVLDNFRIALFDPNRRPGALATLKAFAQAVRQPPTESKLKRRLR